MSNEERFASIEAEIKSLKSGQFGTLSLSEGVKIYDDKGDLKVAFVLVNGQPALKMWGQNKSSILLAVGDGAPEITLSDEEGITRLKATINEDAEPMIMLNDKEENPSLTLSIIDNVSRLMLLNSDKLKVAISSGVENAHIQMYDKDGDVQVNINSDK